MKRARPFRILFALSLALPLPATAAVFGVLQRVQEVPGTASPVHGTAPVVVAQEPTADGIVTRSFAVTKQTLDQVQSSALRALLTQAMDTASAGGDSKVFCTFNVTVADESAYRSGERRAFLAAQSSKPHILELFVRGVYRHGKQCPSFNLVLQETEFNRLLTLAQPDVALGAWVDRDLLPSLPPLGGASAIGAAGVTGGLISPKTSPARRGPGIASDAQEAPSDVGGTSSQ